MKNGGLAPSNFTEAVKFCEIIAKSDLVPAPYKNKPGDILLAIQLGHEIGLQPLQALQNISVINGRPCVWGDALIGIAQNHPHFENIEEKFDEKTETAICIIKRKGQSPCTRTFSIEDAKKAGLLTKTVWKTYPQRMLQMRARSWALRDTFADALKGLQEREEVEDYQPIKNINQSAQVTFENESQETNRQDETQKIDIPPFEAHLKIKFDEFVNSIENYPNQKEEVKINYKKWAIEQAQQTQDEEERTKLRNFYKSIEEFK